MTNLEIVSMEVATKKLMDAEEFNSIIEETGHMPYLTYVEWKKYGYQVKKGSKAIIRTKLWKKVGKKIEKEDGTTGTMNKFILVSASLFGMEQVEKIA